MNQLDTTLPTGPAAAAPGRTRLDKARLTKTRLTKTASIAVLALTLGACNALTRLSEVGQEPPLTAIQNPAVLHGNQLREPILVPRNSQVTIRLQTARMILTVQGRAMEPGAMGDVIRVMNTKTSKIISASVTESGAVEVAPGRLSAAE